MLSRSLPLILAFLCAELVAQEPPSDPSGYRLKLSQTAVTLDVGDKVQLGAELLDVSGRPAEGEVFFFSRARRSVRVSTDGKLLALKPGTFTVMARSTIGEERGPEAEVTVTVGRPEPAEVSFGDAPSRIFVGTTIRLVGTVLDKNEAPREDLEVVIESGDPMIAAVDEFGMLSGQKPGRTTLRCSGGGLTAEHEIEVLANPVASLELSVSASLARTGDVVTFSATTRDVSGKVVEGVPTHFAFHAAPDDNLGNAATGQIEQDGRFVAESPGLYTIVASCGNVVARKTIRCKQRFEQKRKLVKVGHGLVIDVHTSDLWVWEGADGRDYAVTGTWGADGDALFWDVTDPSRLEHIATVTVDARTVNDVKVSADGRLCIISREGASDRKNGIVLYDVEDPRKPKKISEYSYELTGGVHNLFIDDHYVYALSNGRRYDVLDIQNPKAPVRVGSFQLFEPGASIHDVWIDDGIAYSSNWDHGLRLVDVGNGIANGSPSNPVEFAQYMYPSGWNHAAFPFKSPDTNKFYVIGGDEAFPFGDFVKDHPTYARGWLHFVDFTDLKNPKEVARYEVPEAGTHNFWIEGTTLYVAYYNGGLRVVDISGDLMGDLYRQGREIAFFLPTYPKGLVPNAPMVWGPQPHKGHIFFADHNSGLWAVKLVEDLGREN
jgi:hypothetical protein